MTGRYLLAIALAGLAGVLPGVAGGSDTHKLPIGGIALEAWLKAGHYRQWRGESAVHSSQGPHFGKVRAYLNPGLFESLNAGNKEHPMGAVAVKELYGNGEQVLGWSVAIKTEATSALGANWYWYEKYETRVVADDKGVLLCRGCHLTGRDYVLTPWPLR
jgi:hypothetical protein